jgi:hypothetical protein
VDRYQTQRQLGFLLGQSPIASHVLVFAALVPRFARNDFLPWAEGRLKRCAVTSHIRGRRGISVSPWLRELAMAYLRVLSGLVGFSKT